MATKVVPVELGGKTRYLKMTAWSWAELGDHIGFEFRLGHLQEDAAKLLETNVSLKQLIYAAWTALIHAEPELTVRQVGEWIDMGNAGEVLHAFLDACGFQLTDTTREQIERNLGQVVGAGTAES